MGAMKELLLEIEELHYEVIGREFLRNPAISSKEIKKKVLFLLSIKNPTAYSYAVQNWWQIENFIAQGEGS